MFEKLWSKKEVPQDPVESRPSFEDLKAALPENLQEEFRRLGEQISSLGTAKDGKEIEFDYLSPDDQAKVNRYDEITRIATKNVEEKKNR